MEGEAESWVAVGCQIGPGGGATWRVGGVPGRHGIPGIW